MTAGAWMDDGGFVAVSEFVRQRAVLVADPYDPDAAGVPSWDAPDEVTVWGYLASISSTEGADPVRRQVLAAKQLVLDTPGRTWSAATESGRVPVSGWSSASQRST